MEEIKFKPKFTSDLISLGVVIGVIYLIVAPAVAIAATISTSEPLISLFIFVIGLFIALGIFIFAAIAIILSKVFLTYYITRDNELVIEYAFLSKSTKVYRIDQLTSITLYQNWIDKKLGLGTISFDVFGKRMVSANNQQNQMQIKPEFSTIKEYEKIFDFLNKKLNTTKEKAIYTTKPKTSPTKTIATFLCGIFGIGAIISLAINIGLFLVFSALFAIFFFTFFVSIKKIKKTTYSITNNYVTLYHDYFFSKSTTRVPISKITNTKTSKNAISYSLFKVGKSLIYTGGMVDPVFTSLEDYQTFGRYISELSKGKKIQTQKTTASKTSQHKKEIKEEDPVLICKTSPVFFIKQLISTTLFFAIISLMIYFFVNLMWTIAVIGFFLFIILIQFLYWKSLKYEFYTYKVIKYSGIITTISAELHYKNLKYISLRRSMIFDRIAKVGTIYLYTAGSSSIDKSIISVKKFDEIYSSFEEVLEEK